MSRIGAAEAAIEEARKAARDYIVREAVEAIRRDMAGKISEPEAFPTRGVEKALIRALGTFNLVAPHIRDIEEEQPF